MGERRLGVALAVVVATVAVLLWRGLTVTSGAIEVGLLAVALWGFVAGEPLGRRMARVRDVRSRAGSVEVDQAGPALEAERIEAEHDVTVRQDATER